MPVTETFFALDVADMQRATGFYVAALDASVRFSSPRWTSLRIAGVRVALFLNAGHTSARVGLHFVVTDLDATRLAIALAGGRADAAPIAPAPGVLIADVTDTEDNSFSLRQD